MPLERGLVFGEWILSCSIWVKEANGEELGFAGRTLTMSRREILNTCLNPPHTSDCELLVSSLSFSLVLPDGPLNTVSVQMGVVDLLARFLENGSGQSGVGNPRRSVQR